ncbi:hypothetical protein ACISK3_14045 [Morganella morganii]|nr:hypothetical protein [Morganella morganii]
MSDKVTMSLDANEIASVYDFKSPLAASDYFSFELTGQILPNAIPVVDESIAMCIGYLSGFSGVYDVFDAHGVYVGKYEIPLESPMIDPLDFILIGGWFFKNGSKLGHLLKVSTGSIVKAGTVKLTGYLISLLRGRLKIGLSPRTLKFLPQAAAHMNDINRYVPVTILERAIRYGKKGADFKAVIDKNFVRYEIKMIKYRLKDKGKGIYEKQEYILEVIVNEKDWIIKHFLYK